MAGRVYVGTSGFAYPGWSPAFYPRGTRAQDMLREYASRLEACELNNTYYQQPSASRIAAWVNATPESFRFAVKAHRAASAWAFGRDAETTLSWLTKPLADFGTRLGTVLFRVVVARERNDARLERFLAAWPVELPLTLEFRHSSWLIDETYDALGAARAALCVSDPEPDGELPSLRVTGEFLYLRLRRDSYTDADLGAWARRLEPFLGDDRDVYVFFKHDAVGRAAEYSLRLASLMTGSRQRRDSPWPS